VKIREIYEQAVQLGIEADPRGSEEIQRLLEQARKDYEDLKEEDKPFFDQDRLFNPFSDSRVLYGAEDREVHKVLVGIDMEVGEVLLADRLREKGQGVDLIIAHHPEGKALAALYDVMHLQEDVMRAYGVPINVAEGIMASRITEVQRGLMPLNHNRAVNAAQILDLPFMCVHTPADNLVVRFLNHLIEQKMPNTVGDVVRLLKEIPEYREARKVKAGPEITVGSDKKRAGEVFVDMTGGTSGAEAVYEKLARAGVGTIVCMHMPEKHRTEAEKHHLNVIIAGHIASDSLGINLFLDTLASRGVEIVPCSGLIRVSRTN
jgi:putative NIF3 family GTP cyclohydrolase 1 type 2